MLEKPDMVGKMLSGWCGMCNATMRKCVIENALKEN